MKTLISIVAILVSVYIAQNVIEVMIEASHDEHCWKSQRMVSQGYPALCAMDIDGDGTYTVTENKHACDYCVLLTTQDVTIRR